MTRGRSPAEFAPTAKRASGCLSRRLVIGALLVCAGLVVTMCVAMGIGGVSVEIKYVGTGRPVTVVLMLVDGSDPSRVQTTFPARELRPGETTEFDEGLWGDAVLMVRVTRSSSASQEYVVRRYLGGGRRLHLRIELGASGVPRAQARTGYFEEFDDVDVWTP